MVLYFTDNQQQVKLNSVPVMSRKRTRSRSEDSIVVPTKIQPLNVVSQLWKVRNLVQLCVCVCWQFLHYNFIYDKIIVELFVYIYNVLYKVLKMRY